MMSECTHPRSTEWADEHGRSRCGACGDVWDEVAREFVPEYEWKRRHDERNAEVIVSEVVDARPDSELTDEELAARRARAHAKIEAAKDAAATESPLVKFARVWS